MSYFDVGHGHHNAEIWFWGRGGFHRVGSTRPWRGSDACLATTHYQVMEDMGLDSETDRVAWGRACTVTMKVSFATYYSSLSPMRKTAILRHLEKQYPGYEIVEC